MWTNAYCLELDHTSKDDGVFWMELEDFCSNFGMIHCCTLPDDSIMDMRQDSNIQLDGQLHLPDAKYEGVTIDDEWDSTNTNLPLKLEVKELSRVFFIISRPLLSDGIFIGFVVENDSTGERFLQNPVQKWYNSVELLLEPGMYTITPVFHFLQRTTQFKFEAYSPSELGLYQLSDLIGTKFAVLVAEAHDLMLKENLPSKEIQKLEKRVQEFVALFNRLRIRLRFSPSTRYRDVLMNLTRLSDLTTDTAEEREEVSWLAGANFVKLFGLGSNDVNRNLLVKAGEMIIPLIQIITSGHGLFEYELVQVGERLWNVMAAHQNRVQQRPGNNRSA